MEGGWSLEILETTCPLRSTWTQLWLANQPRHECKRDHCCGCTHQWSYLKSTVESVERVGGPVTRNLQKTKTPLVRQAKRLIWKLKQMKNDTRRWIQYMITYGERSSDCILYTFSDCWFIACGFVASREPSQRISEAEMFKHLPSISDAQYFLSHETVCWMVMAMRWKAATEHPESSWRP